VTEIPLPPGHRREIWRHQPTGDEFAVQLNETTGRVQLAHGPINGRANLGGGKFGISTGIELPPWLEEHRDECEVLRYEEKHGTVELVDDDIATVAIDDGSEATFPVPEPFQRLIEIGMAVVVVRVGDRSPQMWPRYPIYPRPMK
jgi:hypothetical protein